MAAMTAAQNTKRCRSAWCMGFSPRAATDSGALAGRHLPSIRADIQHASRSTRRLGLARKIPCAAASEIGLACSRHLGVLLVVVFMDVLGTGEFRPIAEGAPIGHGRRPRHGENASVLDGELELQPLALIVGVDDQAGVVEGNADILL